MPIVKPLVGHTSPETAYVIDDYPCGFKARCKRRVWLEHKPALGFRLCSQTTNPKKAGEVWNAPKRSTYTAVAVMGLDEKGHVTWTGCSMYDLDRLEAFEKEHGDAFGPEQRREVDLYLKARRLYEQAKAKAAAGK